MTSLSRRMLLAQIGSIGLSCLPWASQAASTTLDPIQFTAYRDGSLFGYHKVSFEEMGERLIVEIEIVFDYKLAFIPLYRYRHQNREVWVDGRLVEIATETDDNGTAYRVSGSANDDRFLVDGSSGALDLTNTIKPTSYWNEESLGLGEWLDTQHGKLVRSKVTPLGVDQRLVAGKSVDAAAYALEGDITCTLWYHEGRWVGLRFVASDESIIEYTIEQPA